MDWSKLSAASFSSSPQDGKPGHCTQAQVWDRDGNSLACIEPTEDPAVASANAALFALARNFADACQRRGWFVREILNMKWCVFSRWQEKRIGDGDEFPTLLDAWAGAVAADAELAKRESTSRS